MSRPRREASDSERKILGVLGGFLSPLTAQSLLDSALERAGVSGPVQAADMARLVPLIERGARLFMRSPTDVEAAMQALGKLRLDDRPAAPQPDRAAAPPPVSPRPAARPAPAPAPRPASAASSVRAALATPAVEREVSGPWALPKEGGPAVVMSGAELTVAGPPVVLPIRREEDIVRVRSEVRRLGVSLGASATGQTHLATVVSELARNIVLYASARGVITLALLEAPARGVDVVASDEGPGISDLRLILEGNYRSKMGLGLGLRGVRRLSSFFELRSAPGAGTVVHAQLVIA